MSGRQPWRLEVSRAAERAIGNLPERARFAAMETLRSLPEHPKRLGKPLRLDLEGVWSARRGPYRVLYEIDEEDRVVRVVHVGHRSDVYRAR